MEFKTRVKKRKVERRQIIPVAAHHGAQPHGAPPPPLVQVLTRIPRKSEPEIKYYDTVLLTFAILASTNWAGTMADPGTTVEATPVATPLGLFQPQLGSNRNQRIGREVLVKCIELKARIQNTAALGSQDTIVRLSLVQDKQTNGAQMTGAQLMLDYGSAFPNSMGFQGVENIDRFLLLRDQLYNCSTSAASTWNQQIIQWRHEFVKPVRVRFNQATTGTITSIIDNSFHIVVNNSSSTEWILGYTCRVSYIDE